MIPVPKAEINKIKIFPAHYHVHGRQLTVEEKHEVFLFKEAKVIKTKRFDIIKKARNLYNAKLKQPTLKHIPDYVKVALDFSFAEQKYVEYINK